MIFLLKDHSWVFVRWWECYFSLGNGYFESVVGTKGGMLELLRHNKDVKWMKGKKGSHGVWKGMHHEPKEKVTLVLLWIKRELHCLLFPRPIVLTLLSISIVFIKRKKIKIKMLWEKCKSFEF